MFTRVGCGANAAAAQQMPGTTYVHPCRAFLFRPMKHCVANAQSGAIIFDPPIMSPPSRPFQAQRLHDIGGTRRQESRSGLPSPAWPLALRLDASAGWGGRAYKCRLRHTLCHCNPLQRIVLGCHRPCLFSNCADPSLFFNCAEDGCLQDTLSCRRVFKQGRASGA